MDCTHITGEKFDFTLLFDMDRPTNSQINNAGRILRNNNATQQQKDHAIITIDNWRRLYLLAYASSL